MPNNLANKNVQDDIVESECFLFVATVVACLFVNLNTSNAAHAHTPTH